MMMDSESTLKVFDFDGRKVRIVVIDGEAKWVAKDICDILEISNASDVIKRLEKDEVDLTEVIDPMGHIQRTSTVNESGLYSLILGSRKPEAKVFKRLRIISPAVFKHPAGGLRKFLEANANNRKRA